MKPFSWKIWLSLSLLWLSALFYLLNYLIFKDVNYMVRLFLAQLGFLPISVLLVTIIINQLLSLHAKRSKLAKLNMVIGAFFSEVGLELLRMLCSLDVRNENFHRTIKSINQWPPQAFIAFKQSLPQKNFDFQLTPGDLESLRHFLLDKRDFLLRLLENPNLLEHDAFSNLLLAVFHLTEELAQRHDLGHLPEPDQEHLGGDLQRVYLLLIGQWLDYMQHLQANYPYLFSLALRTNPFDPQASVEIS
ncbi:MAG: hypothetical protein ACOZF2_00370 [Thermodesulfobacteriota bacterium]